MTPNNITISQPQDRALGRVHYRPNLWQYTDRFVTDDYPRFTIPNSYRIMVVRIYPFDF
jgi:hypothetical protein